VEGGGFCRAYKKVNNNNNNNNHNNSSISGSGIIVMMTEQEKLLETYDEMVQEMEQEIIKGREGSQS